MNIGMGGKDCKGSGRKEDGRGLGEGKEERKRRKRKKRGRREEYRTEEEEESIV